MLLPVNGEKEDGLAAALLERGAEDVAERSAGVGRAVLGDLLLLFGDFQRLDRDLNLAVLLVIDDHARIDLLADREALGALLVTVARQIVALDEGLETAVDQPHFEAAILDADDFAGDDRVLAQFARRRRPRWPRRAATA